MALHQRTHPTPVDGCFGCHVVGVGVQTLQIRHGPDPTRRVPIVADRGPSGGRETGHHTHHWDGRVDATVRPDTVRVRAGVAQPGEDR